MSENNFTEEIKGEEIKFIADKMLGKLVKWLRILGFDTTYPSFDDDLSLILTARQESRILLTRNANLIKRRNICKYFLVVLYATPPLKRSIKKKLKIMYLLTYF
jgi:uncharacterized protein with PIN domain